MLKLKRKVLSGPRPFAVFPLLVLAFSVLAQERQRTILTHGEGSATASKRVALVIGNATYIHVTPLANPANDAADMATSLKSLGFEVVSGINLNKREIEMLIRQFGTRLAQTKGTGLFYYAGHGLQVNGENYLVPVDADIPEQDEVQYQAVSVNLVLTKMNSAANDLNIMILDACRNNPFANSWQGVRTTGQADGLARITAPQGTIILYATQPGNVASDGKGRNGMFTESLLRQIKIPNVEFDQMVKNLTREVSERSNRKQFPWREGTSIGDFYFSVNNNVTKNSSPAGGAEPPGAKSGEAVFWRLIEDSKDVVDFENYLARTVSGEFIGTYKATAELKIARLRKANAPVAWAKFSSTAKKVLKYHEVSSFSEGLAKVRINSSYGFIDNRGNEVIPVKYESADNFSDGLAQVRLDRHSGFVNKTGEEVIPLKFDVALASDNLIEVRLNEKWGVVDRRGKEVIPIIYESIYQFYEGLASVRLNGKWGFINMGGEEVIPPKYDSADSFSEGLARVQLNGKYGFIDKTGRTVIPFKYEDDSSTTGGHQSFADGLAAVVLNKKGGFINKTGKEVIPLKYDHIHAFSGGLAVAGLNGKYGCLDKTGKEAIPLKYETEVRCRGGLTEVKLNGKRGFTDEAGKEVIPIKYEEFSRFSEGLVAAKLNNMWGFINEVGNVTIPFRYDHAGSFSEGLAKVKLSDKYGFIDKAGKEVVPIKYDGIWVDSFIAEGFVGVVLDGKRGFVDFYGNEYFDF